MWGVLVSCLLLASLKLRLDFFFFFSKTELQLKWGEVPGSPRFCITQKVTLDNSNVSSWPCSLKIYYLPRGKAAPREKKGCGTVGIKTFCAISMHSESILSSFTAAVLLREMSYTFLLLLQCPSRSPDEWEGPLRASSGGTSWRLSWMLM